MRETPLTICCVIIPIKHFYPLVLLEKSQNLREKVVYNLVWEGEVSDGFYESFLGHDKLVKYFAYRKKILHIGEAITASDSAFNRENKGNNADTNIEFQPDTILFDNKKVFIEKYFFCFFSGYSLTQTKLFHQTYLLSTTKKGTEVRNVRHL